MKKIISLILVLALMLSVLSGAFSVVAASDDTDVGISTVSSTVWVFEPVKDNKGKVKTINTQQGNVNAYTIRSKESGKYLTLTNSNGDGNEVVVTLSGQDRNDKNNGQLWGLYDGDNCGAYNIVNALCKINNKAAMIWYDSSSNSLKEYSLDEHWAYDGNAVVFNGNGTINGQKISQLADASGCFEATMNFRRQDAVYSIYENYETEEPEEPVEPDGTETVVTLSDTESTVWKFEYTGGDVPTHEVYAATYTVKSKASGKYLTAVDNGDGTVSLCTKDRDTSDNGQLWAFDALWGTGPVAIINAGCADPCADRPDYSSMLYYDGGLKKDCQRQSGNGEKTVILGGTDAGISDVTTVGIASSGSLRRNNLTDLHSFEATINFQFPTLYFYEDFEAGTPEISDTAVNLDNKKSTEWVFEPAGGDVPTHSVYAATYTIKSKASGKYLTATDNGDGTVSLYGKSRDTSDNGQLWAFDALWGTGPVAIINAGCADPCAATDPNKADYCAMLYYDLNDCQLKKRCQEQSGEGYDTVILNGTDVGISDVTTLGVASDGNNHPNTSLLRSFEATIKFQFPVLYIHEEYDPEEEEPEEEEPTDETPSVCSFINDNGNENQLWRFEATENKNLSEFYICNISTGLRLLDDNNSLYTSESGSKFTLTEENGVYSFSTSQNQYNFEIYSYKEDKKVSLSVGGTYRIASINEKQFLTDTSEPELSVSEYSNEYSSAVFQKWIIYYAGKINGLNSYNFASLNDKAYLTDDDSVVTLGHSRTASGSLWTIREVTSDILLRLDGETDCSRHYYILTNSNGKTLYYNRENSRFEVMQNIEISKDCLILFNNGEEFDNNGIVHISNLFGDEIKILESVNKDANSLVFTDFYKDSDSQKWVISYVSTTSRSSQGYWYKLHYYTIKNSKYNLYLTIKNNKLSLAKRNSSDDAQLWNLFDEYYGWNVTNQSGFDEFRNHYSIINKKTNEAIYCSNMKLTLNSQAALYGSGGDAGTCWLLDGTQIDLGHSNGNDDSSKLIKKLTVTLKGYGVQNYLDAYASTEEQCSKAALNTDVEKFTDIDIDESQNISTEWKFTPQGTVEYYDVGGNKRTETKYTLQSLLTGGYLTAKITDGELSLYTASKVYDDSQYFILHEPGKGNSYYNLISVGLYETNSSGQKILLQINYSSKLYLEKSCDSGEGFKTWILNGSTNSIESLISDQNSSDESFNAQISIQYPTLYLCEKAYSNLSGAPKAEISTSYTSGDDSYIWKLTECGDYYTVQNKATGNYLTYSNGVAYLCPKLKNESTQKWSFVDCSAYGGTLSTWNNVFEIRAFGSDSAINTIGGNNNDLGKYGLKCNSLSSVADAGGRGWTLSPNRVQISITDGMECVINSYQWGLNYYLCDSSISELSPIENHFVAEKLATLPEINVKGNGQVFYYSSDNTVAAVNDDGRIIGKRTGTVTVSVQAGNFRESFELCVKQFGDINVDDSIDIIDFVKLKKNIAYEKSNESLDDLNMDGSCSADDIIVLREILLGIIV